MKSVCVYCGSSGHVDEKHKKIAQEVGQMLALQGIRLVYGGGRVGLMGIVADSALANGGQVIGIIPEHIREKEIQHTDLTELQVVDSMHERKRRMVEFSDAFIVLPGGFGTLDETFEIMTWKQLGLHRKPIIIFNNDGYWTPLVSLVDHMIKAGFAQQINRSLFSVVSSIEELKTAMSQPCNGAQIDPSTKWA